jgi:nicotinate-nucleotide--dimethylbenzimidazole phosphoribosyltransferase
MNHQLITLQNTIPALDHTAAQAAQTRLDQLTKPPGSLGALEPLLVRLAAITAKVCPTIDTPLVLVAAADHGVVAEGVSPYPQSVTAQMVHNYLRGGAAINALAHNAGARVRIANAGVAATFPDHPLLYQVAQGFGTGNLRREPAMRPEQAVAAILAGATIIEHEAAIGLDLLALGEMGIGNTTAAACLTSVLVGIDAHQATGRGTGLDDAGLAHKRLVVAESVARAQVSPADPLQVLAELGGFEIAVLVGAILAAAARRIPVLLDGYITTAAALVAVALVSQVRGFLLASHCSAESGHRFALNHLDLQPLLDLGMRLGEGTGAAVALPLLRGAVAAMANMATFSEAGVADRPN